MLNVPVHWRITTSVDRRPFSSGDLGRSIRIVVDDRTVPDGDARRLLRAFAERPNLEIYSTDPGAARRVEFEERQPDRDFIPVNYVLPEGERDMAIFDGGQFERVLTEAEDEGHDPREAQRALMLAHAASRHDVDALVIRTPMLESPRWRNLARSAHVATPESAAGLLGLYLRAHGDFTVAHQGTHWTFVDGERYYRGAVHARIALLAGWLEDGIRWWRTESDPTIYSLVRGIEVRLGRALRARDYIEVRIRHHRPDDTWDEVLFFFESLLLLLAGALDAAARVCHLRVGVPGNVRTAGWRREGWTPKPIAAAPELRDMVEPPSGTLFKISTLIGTIRNTIHGEAMSSEIHEPDFQSVDHQKGALALSSEEGRRLIEATDGLSGRAAWGLEESWQAVLVLPATFQATAVAAVFTALEDVARLTENRASADRSESEIPFDPEFWIPAHPHCGELLLLAGLADAMTREPDG